MNVQIPLTRLAAAFVIGVVWVITSFIAVITAGNIFSDLDFIILSIIFFAGCVVTYGILSVLHNVESNTNQSRVDRMLRELDERDLEVLRRRLSPRQHDYYDDGEYESLEDLLDQQKQKRG